MSRECLQDTDCNGTLVCFVNVSWLDESIESRCGCGNWNIYVGEDCQGLGPGAIYMLVVAVMTGLIALAAFIMTSSFVVQAFRRDRRTMFSVFNTTALALSLSFGAMVVWRGTVAHKALTPEEVNLIQTENLNVNRKVHSTFLLETGAITISMIFGVIALLNLSLSWIETARSLSKFTPVGEKRLKRYKIVIAVVDLIWIVLASVLYAQSSALVFFAAAPIFVILASVYAYGAARFAPLISRLVSPSKVHVFNGSSEVYAVLLRSIKGSALLICFGVVLTLSGGLAWALLSIIPEQGWREVSPDGAISPVLITNEIIPLGAMVALLGVTYFLHSTKVAGKRKRDLKSQDQNLKSLATPHATAGSGTPIGSPSGGQAGGGGVTSEIPE